MSDQPASSREDKKRDLEQKIAECKRMLNRDLDSEPMKMLGRQQSREQIVQMLAGYENELAQLNQQ